MIWGEYESGFPVTKVTKFGVVQIIQPIFTREFKVVGAPVPFEEVLSQLQSLAKKVDLRLESRHAELEPLERFHQKLPFEVDVSNGYSTNAKRLIKKANSKFEFKMISDLSTFFKLIEDTLVPKIKEFSPENIAKLKSLMIKAQALQKADCIAVHENGNVVGAGFFFKHQSTITYLKGAATEQAKKNGAMFGLVDYAIRQYESGFSDLDFGGSNIKNVGDFYRKFGAIDRVYYHYELNNLPFWYRWAKKIKK